MSGRRGKTRRRPRSERTFWLGAADDRELPETTGIRAGVAPSALVESLGPPPLPGRETLAAHYFAAVYERAASTAVALAAASGLLLADDGPDPAAGSGDGPGGAALDGGRGESPTSDGGRR